MSLKTLVANNVSIEADDIGQCAITSAKIGGCAVTTAKFQDCAVTTTELAEDAIATKMSVSADVSRFLTGAWSTTNDTGLVSIAVTQACTLIGVTIYFCASHSAGAKLEVHDTADTFYIINTRAMSSTTCFFGPLGVTAAAGVESVIPLIAGKKVEIGIQGVFTTSSGTYQFEYLRTPT